MVVPRLKTWIRKVVAEEKESEKEEKSRSVLADQTAEAAKAAAMAAAVVAKASEELLSSKNEGSQQITLSYYVYCIVLFCYYLLLDWEFPNLIISTFFPHQKESTLRHL